MKTIIYSIVLFLVFQSCIMQAQRGNVNKYLDQLPKNLEIDNSTIRSYKMTTDYYDYDLKSNFNGKRRLTGIITYGLPGDSAQWKDVYMSESKMLDAPFPKGNKLEFLEGFTFRKDERIVTAEFYKDIPEANTLVKNLFWDMLGFDAIAYCCWDSLKLNQEYSAKEINSEVNLADMGMFENLDIKITWVGITKINNEVCAIIKYQAMNNPLELELENMSLSGRSHYWGEIYVSLSDKQIEKANLTEDVLTDVKMAGMKDSFKGYTIRYINVERIK